MKRSELYAAVWAAPVRALAQEVGLSDTRVATICKKHGVPLPARGHWAKLAAGKLVENTPLPQPEVDYEIKVGSGASRRRSTAWVVPGVLERTPSPETYANSDEEGAAPRVEAGSQQPTQQQKPNGRFRATTDLDLLNVAALEFARQRAVEDLLREMLLRVLAGSQDDATVVQLWVAEVQLLLKSKDPVLAMLNQARRLPPLKRASAGAANPPVP